MCLNPAVLQCGPTLDPLSAAEIKTFAWVRSIGNVAFPPLLRGPVVAAFAASIVFTVLTSGTDVPELVAVRDVLRPALGTILAGSFIFTAYAAAKSS